MRNEVVAIMRMGDTNVHYHLTPISRSHSLDMLHVIRPRPIREEWHVQNSKYYEIKSKSKLLQLVKILLLAIQLGKRKEVKAFVSFVAIPYGLIALLAGFWTGKPVHVGFVGSDWNRDCRSWYGGFFNMMLKKAQMITVPGEKIKRELITYGYPEQKIFHLPHAVDIDKFVDIKPEKREFDCIFVGSLIPLKRVDLIISAIKMVRSNFENIKLCIVGDGPARQNLETLVFKNKLEKSITFAGYQIQPASFFSNARINLIASDMEGFPFALVEGMAAGAVPVSTNVGTISEFIEHGKNGLLIPPGDADALANAIVEVITNRNLYHRMRESVLNFREEFRFQKASALWDRWFKEINK